LLADELRRIPGAGRTTLAGAGPAVFRLPAQIRSSTSRNRILSVVSLISRSPHRGAWLGCGKGEGLRDLRRLAAQSGILRDAHRHKGGGLPCRQAKGSFGIYFSQAARGRALPASRPPPLARRKACDQGRPCAGSPAATGSRAGGPVRQKKAGRAALDTASAEGKDLSASRAAVGGFWTSYLDFLRLGMICLARSRTPGYSHRMRFPAREQGPIAAVSAPQRHLSGARRRYAAFPLLRPG